MRPLTVCRGLVLPICAMLMAVGCGEAESPQLETSPTVEPDGVLPDPAGQQGEVDGDSLGSARMAAQIIRYFQEPLSEEEIMVKIDRGGDEALAEVYGLCDATDWARLRAFGFSEEFLLELETKALPDCALHFDVTDAEGAAPTEASVPDAATPPSDVEPAVQP